MDNYTVVMNTRPWIETGIIHHLPTFLIPACSPQEAIIKVRAMFPEGLRVAGTVLREEPHADRMMDFDE